MSEVNQPSDFNDLHLLAGLPAVKKQIDDLITGWQKAEPSQVADSPAPSQQSDGISLPVVEGKEETIDVLLKRYALILPSTNVWDTHQKEVLKKAEFMASVGAKSGKEWFDSAGKRQVREEDVNKILATAQAEGEGELAKALRRYTYLNPSQTVWDHDRRQLTPIADLKYAIPNEFAAWNRHPCRRQIEKENLVFDPTQQSDAKTHINMFHGLPLSPVDNDEACQAIRMMMFNLCNQDKEVWSWLAKWLAYPLQHVGAKMATAVLMHSDVHGSGKSLLFDGVMRPIYGEYGATLGQTQMESQYTDWSSNLLYGLFEEVFSRDQKYSHMGTIKQMITGEKQRIEKKFIAGWEEANHMNCIFLSNELLPFPIEASDRRFLVIWPNSKLDPLLQQAVSHELKNGGAEAFYDWLLKVDTSDFDRHTKPPMTEAKEWVIDYGRPGWDKFYMSWSTEELDVPYIPCLTTDLWLVYKAWCRKNGVHKVLDNQKFPQLIEKKVVRKESHQPYVLGDKSAKEKKGTFYLTVEPPTDTDKPKKVWLGECVAEFRTKMGEYIGVEDE